MNRRPSETSQDDDLDDVRPNPNILGARPSGFADRVPTSDRQHVDAVSYDSTSVGAAAMTTPMASVLASPPPSLSARPRTARLPPLDRSKLSVTGRQLPELLPQTGINAGTDNIKKEIKSLEKKIKQMSGRKLSFSAERDGSVRSKSHGRRDHIDPYQSEHRVGAAASEPLPPQNVPQTAGATIAASQSPRETAKNTASDSMSKRSLPTIKLDSYDGSTPLQTHLSKLANCASYYSWGPNDRLCHLKASLVGQAGEVLWQLTDNSTEADVVRLLKNRFGSDHQTECYRLKLQSRRRKPGEPTQAVYNDVRRLLALSFPGQLCELLGMDYFLSALADPALRVRVLDQSPKNLDDALVIVSRMEAYSGSGAGTGGPMTDPGRGKVNEVKSEAVGRDDKRIKQLEDELASHRRQIHQLKADNEFWKTGHANDRQLHNRRWPSGRRALETGLRRYLSSSPCHLTWPDCHIRTGQPTTKRHGSNSRSSSTDRRHRHHIAHQASVEEDVTVAVAVVAPRSIATPAEYVSTVVTGRTAVRTDLQLSTMCLFLIINRIHVFQPF